MLIVIYLFPPIRSSSVNRNEQDDESRDADSEEEEDDSDGLEEEQENGDEEEEADKEAPKKKKKAPRRGPQSNNPKSFQEFSQEVHNNLLTKDGLHAKAVDDRTIKCVCGKNVRLCNPFYWKYLIQKPSIRNGVVIQKGHWYACAVVQEKGSLIHHPPKISEEEIEASKIQASSSLRRQVRRDSSRGNSENESDMESGANKRRSRRVRDHDEPSAKKTKEDGGAGSGSSSSASSTVAAEPSFSMEGHIRELLAKRVPGETFLQDGPCLQMAFDVSMCHMCR